MSGPISLFLFRRDLRLSDQPALSEAVALGLPIIPLVIQDPNSPIRASGAASKIFYEAALKSLNKDLGGVVRLYRGSLAEALKELSLLTPIARVFWNKGATPQEVEQDALWMKDCQQAHIATTVALSASLLWEPAVVNKTDGTPYKVFTPFYKKGCLEVAPAPRHLIERVRFTGPKWTELFPDSGFGVSLENAFGEPPAWALKILSYWDVSEKGAKALWKRFALEASSCYKEGRNRLDQRGTTELSPYLACGIVSPHQLWHAAEELPPSPDREHFCQELGWREFSANLLHHFPELYQKNWNAQFDNFPWKEDSELLERWQQGQTGIPIVDAGMRQLWETGYMHNRARMIVGSFLVKNLLLPWQKGEAWFWDCLIDADLANNSASWQWVAGSGADAAPYFRIFNPILQAEKFDPQGLYVQKYVKELSSVPTQYLSSPWEHAAILPRFGIILGQNYPRPVVCLKGSREEALSAFQRMKS